MKLVDFLDKKNKIAVVGVSANPKKWGRKVFEELKSKQYTVFAVNPKHSQVGSSKCFPSLKSLPSKPGTVITVTPPRVTMQILKQCRELGIKQVWMQPGSESKETIEYCEKNGIGAIYNACIILDALGKRGE